MSIVSPILIISHIKQLHRDIRKLYKNFHIPFPRAFIFLLNDQTRWSFVGLCTSPVFKFFLKRFKWGLSAADFPLLWKEKKTKTYTQKRRIFSCLWRAALPLNRVRILTCSTKTIYFTFSNYVSLTHFDSRPFLYTTFVARIVDKTPAMHNKTRSKWMLWNKLIQHKNIQNWRNRQDTDWK